MHVITLHIKASLNEAGHIYTIYLWPLCWIRPERSINRYWLVILIVVMFDIYRTTLLLSMIELKDFPLSLTFSVSLSQYGTWYKSYSPLVSMRTAYGAPNYDTPLPPPFCFAYNRLSRSQKYTLICASLNPN